LIVTALPDFLAMLAVF